MSFEIRLMPQAEETYMAITEQIFERWGNKILTDLEKRTRKAFQSLATNPYIYPIANDLTGLRKCLLHKNCSMLFKIDDSVVVIVCFWDNRQEPMF